MKRGLVELEVEFEISMDLPITVDIKRRMQQAAIAFRRIYALWLRKDHDRLQ